MLSTVVRSKKMYFWLQSTTAQYKLQNFSVCMYVCVYSTTIFLLEFQVKFKYERTNSCL